MSTLDRRWRDTFSTSNNFAVKIWTKRSAQKMILSPRRHWSFVRLYLQHCHSHSECRSRFYVTTVYNVDTQKTVLQSCKVSTSSSSVAMPVTKRKKCLVCCNSAPSSGAFLDFQFHTFIALWRQCWRDCTGNCAEKYRSCLATQQSGFLEHEQSCISAPSYRWVQQLHKGHLYTGGEHQMILFCIIEYM